MAEHRWRCVPWHFLAFSDVELGELSIALDHRRAEAEAGNAYVYTPTVDKLIREVEDEERRRGHRVEPRELPELDDTNRPVPRFPRTGRLWKIIPK